jgi:archaemetzincin
MLRKLQQSSSFIWLHSFGNLNDALLSAISREVEKQFSIKTQISHALPVPKRFFVKSRQQYLSTGFLEELVKLGVTGNQIRLGVTGVDLFIPELNFVFGEASPECQVAVFSTARLDPVNYGKTPNEKLLLNRSVTEAIHELGHVFELRHCNRPNCVMWFSNTLPETDQKGSSFCSICSLKLRSKVA